MILWEPFAGSAAVGLAAFGCRPVCNYMGGKARIAAAILDLSGFHAGDFDRLILNDAGPWGDVWACDLEDVAARVEAFIDSAAPAELYEAWRGTPPGASIEHRAAVFCLLQSLNFRGKPVSERPNGWKTDGLDTTSAHGCAKTERFGGVDPQYLKVPDRLRAISHLPISGGRVEIDLPGMPDDMTGWFVYLDPPYAGTTCGYAAGCPIGFVAGFASECVRRGATVAISYNRPVQVPGIKMWFHDLTPTGKTSRLGRAGRGDHVTARAEWLSVSVPPRQLCLLGGG